MVLVIVSQLDEADCSIAILLMQYWCGFPGNEDQGRHNGNDTDRFQNIFQILASHDFLPIG